MCVFVCVCDLAYVAQKSLLACAHHWKPACFCLHGIHTIILPSSCSSGSELAIWAPFRMDLALWRKMGACYHSNAACHSHSHDIGREECCRLMYSLQGSLSLSSAFGEQRSSFCRVSTAWTSWKSQQEPEQTTHSGFLCSMCICTVCQSIIITDKDCLARCWGVGTHGRENKFCWCCCCCCIRCSYKELNVFPRLLSIFKDICERIEVKVIWTTCKKCHWCPHDSHTYSVITFGIIWAMLTNQRNRAGALGLSASLLLQKNTVGIWLLVFSAHTL